jgi:hypothetical protein
VWPQNTTLHKFGGPGYEWVWADGSKVDYRGAFSDLARFLYSDHTLQIRSPENLFLTAMQIGDANTMGEPAAVEGMAGVFWIGALLDKERLVIFSKTEKPLAEFYYSINSSKTVKHLLTELDRRREYTVTKGAAVVAKGTTGPNGTIAFSDQPNGGAATYTVKLGAASAVSEDEEAMIPQTLELRNHPNPFNPNTTITFSLPKSGKATLRIYNTAGQLVRTLISDTLTSGTHQMRWEATNDDGSRVSSGVYLCRLEFGGLVSQVKLVLAK